MNVVRLTIISNTLGPQGEIGEDHPNEVKWICSTGWSLFSCRGTYIYLLYLLDIQFTVVYLCVTSGVTDSLVLISLGIPLPRSVLHSCIYSYILIYIRWESLYPGDPETLFQSQSLVLV